MANKKVNQPGKHSFPAQPEPGNDRVIQPKGGSGTDTVLREQMQKPFGKTLTSPKK